MVKSRTLLLQGKLKWDEDSSGGRHVRRKVKWARNFRPLAEYSLGFEIVSKFVPPLKSSNELETWVPQWRCLTRWSLWPDTSPGRSGATWTGRRCLTWSDWCSDMIPQGDLLSGNLSWKGLLGKSLKNISQEKDFHMIDIHATFLSECMEHPFLKKFKLRGASRSTSSCVLR